MTADFSKVSGPNYHPINSRISFLDAHSIHLVDGSVIETPDDTTIVQCTGYTRAYPFLDVVDTVSGTDFHWDDSQYPLETNERHTGPLYKHLLPLSRSIPLGSLVFGCLFPIIWNLPTSYAQGLWLGHILANMDVGNDMLPSRDEGLDEVRELERRQRSMGMDGSRSL